MLDAILSLRAVAVAVDHKSELQTSQFEVSQELSVVNTFDLLDDLEFGEQFVFDEYVDSIPTIKADALVLGRLGMRELERDSVPSQWMSQTLFIQGFQELRFRFAMKFDGTTDHTIGKFAEFRPSW